ncbi:MAG: thioredoxin family protein [Ginsengibacter sp.]
MKQFFSAIFFLLVFSFAGKAQQYEFLTDSLHPAEKILKGIISKSDLENNPPYNKWYAESQQIYPVPNEDAVKGMRKNKDNVTIVIFGGTWCEDTHFVLPKFFEMQEASGFPENRITLYAVDRNKKTTGTIAEDYHIINVPTIIVMKDNKEVGRVVEYGKTGKWDKEFADIFSE